MLVPCESLIGHTTIVDHEPRITIHRDVLYVPTGRAKRDEGLFDQGHKLIEDAGYFRAHPDPVSLLQTVNTLEHDRFVYAPDDVRYVFLGALTGHYGHFITGSLARAWAIEKFDRQSTKFVLLNHGSLSTPLRIPWIRDFLGAFEISERDLVNFSGPTRFREIVVPAPAFEEGNFAHKIFGQVCGRAGERLVRSRASGGRPVFLTKMHLSGGVSRIRNEDELCRRLADVGFEIVAPERLQVTEQVRLFLERPIIAGIAGSALHTAIFAPGRLKFELHPEPQRLTNQLLLDGVQGGRTIALFPLGRILHETASPGFSTDYSLPDPSRIAADLLEATGWKQE
jgi:hypothetical protein